MSRFRFGLLLLCIYGLTLNSATGQDGANKALLLNVSKGQIPNDTGLEDQTKLAIVDSPELGGKALKVPLAAEDSFGVRQSAVPNWKKYVRLRFNAFNPTTEAIDLELNVVHSLSTSYQTRVVHPIKLTPGKSEIAGLRLLPCHDRPARGGGGVRRRTVPARAGFDAAAGVGVPFLDELDDVCRHAFERVIRGWPGHVFTVLDVRRPRNRRLAAGVVMPYDSLEDAIDVIGAGGPGERLASGLVISDDESAEAHDAFEELAHIMLVAALAQRLSDPPESDVSAAEPFTAHDLIAAKPALLLDVQSVPSGEFAGRLVSFAGHYSLALLGKAPKAG